MKSRDFDPRAAIIAGACLYEAAAIVTGAFPTVTWFAWSVRKTWIGRVVIWLVSGYFAHHLLFEQPKQ